MRNGRVIFLVLTFGWMSCGFLNQAQAQKAGPEKTAARLPVTRVILYKNGVGYFEHSGHVRGNQDVNIEFTTAQLNDVLKSLTSWILERAGSPMLVITRLRRWSGASEHYDCQ